MTLPSSLHSLIFISSSPKSPELLGSGSFSLLKEKAIIEWFSGLKDIEGDKSLCIARNSDGKTHILFQSVPQEEKS